MKKMRMEKTTSMLHRKQETFYNQEERVKQRSSPAKNFEPYCRPNWTNRTPLSIPNKWTLTSRKNSKWSFFAIAAFAQLHPWKKGNDVRIEPLEGQGLWKKGVIIAINDVVPRSLLVKSETGAIIRRNVRHLNLKRERTHISDENTEKAEKSERTPRLVYRWTQQKPRQAPAVISRMIYKNPKTKLMKERRSYPFWTSTINKSAK